MSALKVIVNGEAVKDVVGISYIENISKFRVVTNLDNNLISNEYDADNITIEITGKPHRTW